MKILLPDSIDLTIEMPNVETITYAARKPAPAEFTEHSDAQVLVTWANSRKNLASAAQELQNLELVQSLAAGTDTVEAAGFAASAQISSGRSLHDGPVTEHGLALILALVRALDHFAVAQQRREWDREFNHAQRDPAREHLFTLQGANVVIWGFGSIAERLAPVLALLGARVSGIANSAGTRAGFPVVATENRDEVLRDADLLVSLLPATPETERTLNAETIDLLPDHALFVNLGRGATVDEPALIEALRTGRLRAAALDVTTQEPLPSTSPLWTTPNLIITPHAAGNRPQNSAALIRENVEHLLAGEPIRNPVDRG